MYIRVSEYDFTEAFRRIRPNSFSYEGLKALFAYLEDFEEDTGQQIEFDVIALCCEFTEYDSEEEARDAYPDGPEIVARLENGGVIVHVY